MKRMLKLWIIIFLLSLAAPAQLLGSRMIGGAVVVYYVMDGMLFSLSQGVASPISLISSSFNPAPYEGKKIRLQVIRGPRTSVVDFEKGIEVLGAYDEEERVAIQKGLPRAYQQKAQIKAVENDWNNAWKYLNKAIEIDSSNCSLYATKANFYANQGKFEEAVKEAQRAVDYGCKQFQAWEFLGELLEKVGKISAAIDAYEQAVQVCKFKLEREQIQQIIDQLKSGARKPPQWEGAFQHKGIGTHYGGPPVAVTPERRNPPPPSMPVEKKVGTGTN